MDHGEHLLRLAQRENRDQDTAATSERVINRIGQASLLRRARETFGQWIVAPCRLDDQHIDGRFRKYGAFGDRLVVEVHIAGVKNRPPFCPQNHTRRAEDVTGLDEFNRDGIRLVRLGPFAFQCEWLTYWTPSPSTRRPIGFLVGEERVDRHSDFFTLSRHDADRVVQERAPDFGGCFRHEDARLGLAPHQHR